jgi:hypothetical protein
MTKVTALAVRFGSINITPGGKRDSGHVVSVSLSFDRKLLSANQALTVFLAGPLNVVLTAEADLFAPVSIKTTATVRGVGCSIATFSVRLRLPIEGLDLLELCRLTKQKGALEITHVA